MKDVIIRNTTAEQYICAARKNFIQRNGVLSESSSKMLICHFSDLHADWKRFQNVMDVIEYYQPAFAIHTGDLVCWDSNSETDIFFQEIAKSSVPVYNAIGNHETFQGESVLSNAYLHNRYIAPLKNIQTNGKSDGYYYVDFPSHALRLIVLNDYENEDVPHYSMRNYELRQPQIDWLIAVLKDCEEKNLAVMIASHESDEPVLPNSNQNGFCQRFEPYPWSIPSPHESIVADIVDAFQYGKTLNKEYVWKVSGACVKVDCSFVKRSEFICYVNGHRHGDYVGYLPTYPQQLSMGMTCTGCFPEGYHNIGEEISDLSRIPDTVSEDAINMYVLDRERKEISVVRIGANVNDLFEKRLAAKYRYGIESNHNAE